MADPFLPKIEDDLLAHWKREGIFAASLKRPSPAGNFVFYEGPPYANGQPGVHHMLSRAYKDAVARYKTMRGYHVGRRAGWDTHGLPVEMAVEKLLGVKSKREIEEKIGVEQFVAECRKNVFLMKGEWEKFTERMGYWVDLDDAYVTLTPEYIESCWWIFSEIAKRGLLYKDFKVVPFCTRCGTALSSHEMAQGYKKVTDRSVYLKFKLKPGQKIGTFITDDKTFVLAWTTTPWTLPGNVALAVGTKIPYMKVRIGSIDDPALPLRAGESYIFAATDDADRRILGVQVTHPDGDESQGDIIADGKTVGTMNEIIDMKSDDLVNLEYQPLFDFLDLGKETGKDAYKIVPADFVTTEDGTGVVHTAVMYGDDDFKLGAKHDLPKKHTVDDRGKFTALVKPWAGQYVKDPKVEQGIIDYLKANGKLYGDPVPYSHDYPFCWRCDTPLLYYAKDSWFFKTTAVKEQMLAENAKINWVPGYLKEGRVGKWLRNVQDWAISRERYWGVPLPIWQCPNGHQQVIGSYEALRAQVTTPLPEPFDPHRPFIDSVKLRCAECSSEMERVPEVADVWFDSGSMPLAQWHYPFEHKELIDSGEQYPADFISEGIDQTRGWFYTLLAVASLLSRPAPYKNVISLGLVNDAEGKKMSKRLGNLILPKDLFPKYGSDAVRFYLYAVSQAGEFKNFDPHGVDQVVKKTFLILANVLSFYELYAPAGSPRPAAPAELTELQDRWLAARGAQLTQKMTEALEQYDLTSAARACAAFITDLSTWYLRRSRDRFREPGDRRTLAVAVLGQALETSAKLLAPFAPFMADHVYRRVGGSKASVHLEDWPAAPTTIDTALLTQMETVRDVVETGHALRKAASIRLRQPLTQVTVSGTPLPDAAAALLRDELNVKEIHFVPTQEKLPRGTDWKVQLMETAGGRDLPVSGVALDITVTDELLIEGLKRELVRHLNAARKDQRLTVADRVVVAIATESELLRGIVERYNEELRREVRADRIEVVTDVEGPVVALDGYSAHVRLTKAG